MRIISQDKTTDVSYDVAVIYTQVIADNQICVIVHVPDKDFWIGTYNSSEDAVYVVSLIQKTFMCNHKYFYMPEAEEVSAIKKKLEKYDQEVSQNE